MRNREQVLEESCDDGGNGALAAFSSHDVSLSLSSNPPATGSYDEVSSVIFWRLLVERKPSGTCSIRSSSQPQLGRVTVCIGGGIVVLRTYGT